MAFRVCSECGGSLDGKPAQAKTCGTKCRSARSRRLKRQKVHAAEQTALPPELKEVSERVRGETPDIARHVIEEELRPVVRESITADTLHAIAQMVSLTPAAVAAITEDLASEDSTIRQRAYTLLLKYTVGHRAIITPDDSGPQGPMHVHFDLPRPEETETYDAEAVEEVVEMKTCDSCGNEKPVDEFAANSLRCSTCYEAQRNRANELLDETT